MRIMIGNRRGALRGTRPRPVNVVPAVGVRSTARRPLQRNVAASAAAAGAAKAPGMDKYVLPNGVVDYYEVLGVDDDAGSDEIKKAYRALAKECHPDYLGEDGHNICILLNEAYQILSDPVMRGKYDAELAEALQEAEDDYTGEPLSKWMPSVRPQMAKNKDPAEQRAVFVDELTCIGCRNCIWCAPATFRLERDHGRSRVFAQWLNTEQELQDAIDSCPVTCIHWVNKTDLPALEYVTQKKITERPNVGMVMSGLGAKIVDVFDEAKRYQMRRQELAQKKAAAAANARYSAAQDAARRQAANDLMTRTGWFNAFSTSLGGMFSTVASAVASAVTEDSAVGQRKRRVRWDERERMKEQAEQQYSVPPERALVPISVYVNSSPSLLRRAAAWATESEQLGVSR